MRLRKPCNGKYMMIAGQKTSKPTVQNAFAPLLKAGRKKMSRKTMNIKITFTNKPIPLAVSKICICLISGVVSIMEIRQTAKMIAKIEYVFSIVLIYNHLIVD